MARGRIIDKEFFSHPVLGDLPINARYLYVGMVIFADDMGRLKADPKFLKAKIFPFDEVIRICSVKDWRDSLSASGLIQIYAAGGQEYLVHPNWEKWQPLRNDRVKPSVCPPPNECQPNVNQMSTKCQPNDRLTQPNLTQPNLSKGTFVPPTPEEIKKYCEERKNSVDYERFFDFYESKGWFVGRNKMKEWRAAVRTWERSGEKPVMKEVINRRGQDREALEKMKEWEKEQFECEELT